MVCYDLAARGSFELGSYAQYAAQHRRAAAVSAILSGCRVIPDPPYGNVITAKTGGGYIVRKLAA